MSISDYLGRVREKIAHDLLLVPSVTALVLDDRRRLLLLRHSDGDVWVAPAGAVDPEERPADSVVREVHVPPWGRVVVPLAWADR